MRKIYQLSMVMLFAIAFTFKGIAQNSFFKTKTERAIQVNGKHRAIIPSKFKTIELNNEAVKSFLWSLPNETNIGSSFRQTPVLEVPMPNGQIAKFNVWETNIQSPELAAKFPTIKTFAGQGITDPNATIWLDYGPRGLHAQILTVNGTYYIDPYAVGDVNNYITYYKKDLSPKEQQWVCEVGNIEPTAKPDPTSNLTAPCRGTQMRTYRLAVACTGEYAQAPGIAAGTNAVILHNAIVTSVNRVVGVYRTELSISMTLVPTNGNVEFLNAATDPFTGNNNANTLINESQTVCDNNIGAANYDIGHTFSTGGGGLAQLNSPCGASKARGITGSGNPTGDAYDIDYVAHEMGHQFGGSHTFNGGVGSCAGNRSAANAFEVGSGTSIQGYAGICGSDNIQPNSDPFFHGRSFDQISNFVSGTGGTCGTVNATGNQVPVINALPNNNLNIPISTPFTLSGSAVDPDGDAVTYCWEQWDLGASSAWNGGATAAAANTLPLFKYRVPKTVGERTFPDMAVILAGYPAAPAATIGGLKGETLSPVARAMKFKLTVRDNRVVGGGVASSGTEGCQTNVTYQVNVINTAAPFAVTVPNGGENYAGTSSQTITWNTVGTQNAPISVANVNILLSTDGGLTYPTVVLANTPNDGNQVVTIPAIPTTTARIKVEAVGNIFFDISNANFTITGAPACGAATGLAASNIANNSATVSWNAVANAVSYAVYYKLNSSSTWTSFSTAQTTTSANLTGLTQGSLYDWRVQATCAGGTGNYVAAQFTTTAPASCNAPTGLASSSITTSGATVSWSAVSGAASYDVEYKLNSATVWANAATATTSTSVALSGLTASTLYDWRVRANCTAVGLTSAYSLSQFTTAAVVTCPGIYDVSTNGTTGGAATIPFNTDIKGTVSASGDNDYYKFVITTGGTITMTLTTLPANYHLRLLNSAGSTLQTSSSTGTTNETISRSVTPGTYYARVYPSNNNQFNATNCYTLRVQLGTASRIETVVSEYVSNGLKVSPNPTSSKAVISFNGGKGGIATITIANQLGAIVSQQTINTIAGVNNKNIDVSKLANGVYYIKVQNGEAVKTTKIVVGK